MSNVTQTTTLRVPHESRGLITLAVLLLLRMPPSTHRLHPPSSKPKGITVVCRSLRRTCHPRHRTSMEMIVVATGHVAIVWLTVPTNIAVTPVVIAAASPRVETVCGTAKMAMRCVLRVTTIALPLRSPRHPLSLSSSLVLLSQRGPFL